MSTSLRQRRHRRDEGHSDEDELEIFVQQYNNARSHGGSKIVTCRAIALFVAIVILAASAFLHWKSVRSGGASSSLRTAARKDLKLVTVYPYSVSSLVHEMDGQTELLVTNDNRDAVDAIRTSIGMANNLRYDHGGKYQRRRTRKKKKGGVVGILLGVTNFIANLRTGEEEDGLRKEGFVPGDIVLKSFDEVKIHNYLMENGAKCSNNRNRHVQSGDARHHDLVENTILRRYNELITSMTAEHHDHHMLDSLWSHVIRLFTWCQFANGDARGYVAFGTSINKSPVADDSRDLHEMLEEARLAGVGIAVKERKYNDDNDASSQEMEYEARIHHSPLFVLPNKDDTFSRGISMKFLYSLLEEEEPALPPVGPEKSMQFEIREDWLQKWNSKWRGNDLVADSGNNVREQLHESDNFEELGNDIKYWLFLQSIGEDKMATSELRWLARYCKDSHCSFVIDSR